ncbi:MAG: HDIG domain-containing protein [Treponema sp.]|jgi:putative nucleotidyltransferase with HDIG domain|nr:HDIG domain-containing protein [Treponema sp.]
MKKYPHRLFGDVFFKTLLPGKLRKGPVLVSLAAFALSLVIILWGRGYFTYSSSVTQEFEAGMVAEREVVAEEPVSYVDEEATGKKLEALEHEVPAVFSYSVQVSEDIRNSYKQFVDQTGNSLFEAGSPEEFIVLLEGEFSGFFPRETLIYLYEEPERESFPGYGLETLEFLLESGIFALPEQGLEGLNPNTAELRHNYGPRTEREEISYDRIITMDRVESAIEKYIAGRSYPPVFAIVAAPMLKPFITENVFYSPEDTQKLLTELRDKVEPVLKHIEPGKRIVRKGFIITESEMEELQALHKSTRNRDPRLLIGMILVLILLYGLFVFLLGKQVIGRLLKPQEVYLLSILTVLYIGGAVFCKNLAAAGTYPVAVFLPTALVIMLPSILIDFRSSFAVAVTLPLVALLSGAFDVVSYVFAFTSAAAAAYAIRGAERRMDLFKAGMVIAIFNCIAILAILLIQRNSLMFYPLFIFWAAFNGVVSGMLVLGCLPILEHALNSATVFRLMELSDLNAPILKRLFSAAPGTYSHSLMVATLAENACQEIGANSLLARVGSYYHDIGKMENPEYFVENQTVYNKHNELNPRLSATVIRSHVKLGVEKARALGLPKEVTDIVAEHHGNSVISWFYHEALKRENQVTKDDFTYPGNPPHSRESAVVMLADVTEAACRTLKKPTASRLEKFIQELIMAKVEHGQLSESDLTFRDLETIKNAFVRVLAGHYHARIEYPKAPSLHEVNKEAHVPGGRE